MAGFQVSTYGRFWVSTEGQVDAGWNSTQLLIRNRQHGLTIEA